jgi:hypothetical protein
VDHYIRVEPYLALHIPAHRSLANAARVGYAFYTAVGDGQYSFRRLSASDVTSVPLLIGLRPARTTSQRSGLANFFCPSVRSGAHCSLGDLSLSGRIDDAKFSGQVLTHHHDGTLVGGSLLGLPLRGCEQF